MVSCSRSHVLGVVAMVVIAALVAPQSAIAADIYGDPVFVFSMDTVNFPSADGFFSALQSCLGSPTLSQQGHTVSTDSGRTTVKFVLQYPADIASLKVYIDQNETSMTECLHQKAQVTNVNAGYVVITPPPTTAPPSSTTTDKMLEIGLPLGGCFIGVLFGLFVAFMCIRARNARLAEEGHSDLNQPMTDKSGAMPPPRKAAPAPVRRGADLA